MKRGVSPDPETVEYTAVSLRFDVQVSDPLCGHICPLHCNIAVRTVTLVGHFSVLRLLAL